MSSNRPTSPVGNWSAAGVVLVLGIAFFVLILVLGLVYLAGQDGQGVALDWLERVILLVLTGTSTAGVAYARRAKVQTNGGLDVRMRQAMRDVLAELQENDGQTGDDADADDADAVAGR